MEGTTALFIFAACFCPVLADLTTLPPVLVFAGPHPLYHQGVIGIVCTRIAQETNWPVFIGSINAAGNIHGSARVLQCLLKRYFQSRKALLTQILFTRLHLDEQFRRDFEKLA